MVFYLIIIIIIKKEIGEQILIILRVKIFKEKIYTVLHTVLLYAVCCNRMI